MIVSASNHEQTRHEIAHDPNYVLAVDGYPLLVVAETYHGNGGALDTSGLTRKPR